MDLQERDSFLSRVIWYPRFKTAYDTLVHCMNFGGNDEEALLLYGPVGAGKSYLLEQLQRDFPNTENDEQTFRPILYARVAASSTDAYD
ncbi:TniB family NTP-binding protein [Vibrio parahaemolyticus]|uniref:TniB family NTP-binding protein n=1 Tax=Vibrio parahaemolyticus TaxID=670 RepID=UPI003891C834